jgi:HupH hydrogenase expression protein, C-terminal conserved region
MTRIPGTARSETGDGASGARQRGSEAQVGASTRLAQIPVRIEGPPAVAETGTIGGGVIAILNEIATLLEQVASTGESAAIDLRSLPMSPGDRAQLLEALGPGEVEITLRADGDSCIRETGVQGVWWTEHRDRNGAVIAGFIEIARVPEILLVPGEELLRGAGRLRASARARVALPTEGESSHART